MVQKINGQLVFTYSRLKQPKKSAFKLSLLSMLIGIFLLPNLAYLSEITPEKLIELTNKERQNSGLNLLTANQLLTQAATLKGQAILDSQTFKHTINDKKFSGWIKEAGYNYSYVGENLAIDFNSSEGVIEAWKNSLLHKKNLLSPYYQEIGLAAVAGKFQGQETTVIVQIFGAPAQASVQPLTPNNNGWNANGLTVTAPQIDSAAWSNARAENLLTHAISERQFWPEESFKLALPYENSQAEQLNKFIIQPADGKIMNNFFMIFSAITLLYFLISLYYYYFLKINNLAA